MDTILLLTHTEADGSMPRAALEALTAATALREKLDGARLVVGLYGAKVMPGVAHRLGGRVDTHVVSLEVADGALAVSRWFYRQRMQGVLERSARPWVLVLDAGVHPPFGAAAGSATVEAVQVALSDGHRRTSVTGERSPESDEQTIRPDADLLFVAGAGWTKKQADGEPHVEEAAGLIRAFLGSSKASLGSSKS